jgi:hypothetical protein
LIPSLCRADFQEELLKGGVELPDGLLFIDPRIALKALQRGVECKGQSFRQLRLPATRWAFNQDWLFQLAGNIDLGDGDFINVCNLTCSGTRCKRWFWLLMTTVLSGHPSKLC